MNKQQRESANLRESFMRLAGKTFRKGYEAVSMNRTDIAKKTQTLYSDCLRAAAKCSKLDKLAAKLG